MAELHFLGNFFFFLKASLSFSKINSFYVIVKVGQQSSR